MLRRCVEVWRAVDSGVLVRVAGRVCWNIVVWSHLCGWTDLATIAVVPDTAIENLALAPGWPGRWMATCRRAGVDITAPVRDLAGLSLAGCQPVRYFSWHRSRSSRPNLAYYAPQREHRGCESLAETRLLLALEFAGDTSGILSQPVCLQFGTSGGSARHVPDYLIDTATGRWLIDVRPFELIDARAELSFAAAAQVAAHCGWGYAVVSGWRRPAFTTVDALSAQRRPLLDPLGVLEALREAAAGGPQRFDALAASTAAPAALARAFLIHLLWHREVGVDLREPLGDSSIIVPAAADSVGR